jgi:hypothetical protein
MPTASKSEDYHCAHIMAASKKLTGDFSFRCTEVVSTFLIVEHPPDVGVGLRDLEIFEDTHR